VRALFAAIVLSAAVGTPAPSFGLEPEATTVLVNTATDELNADGDCSLREAIRAANLDQGLRAQLRFLAHAGALATRQDDSLHVRLTRGVPNPSRCLKTRNDSVSVPHPYTTDPRNGFCDASGKERQKPDTSPNRQPSMTACEIN